MTTRLIRPLFLAQFFFPFLLCYVLATLALYDHPLIIATFFLTQSDHIKRGQLYYLFHPHKFTLQVGIKSDPRLIGPWIIRPA